MQRIRKGVNLAGILEDFCDHWVIENQQGAEEKRYFTDEWASDPCSATQGVDTVLESKKIKVPISVMTYLNGILHDNDAGVFSYDSLLDRRETISRLCDISSPFTFPLSDGMEDEVLKDIPPLEGCDLLHPMKIFEGLTTSQEPLNCDERLDLYSECRKNASSMSYVMAEESPDGNTCFTSSRIASSPMPVPGDSVEAIPSLNVAPNLFSRHGAGTDRNLLITQETDASLDRELIELADSAVLHERENIHLIHKKSRFETAKITIPTLSTIRPAACEADSELYLQGLVKDVLTGPVESQMPDSRMNWRLFAPTLASDFQTEAIMPKDRLSKIISEFEEHIRSDQLLWRPMGTKLLEDDEDDGGEIYLIEQSSDPGEDIAPAKHDVVSDRPQMRPHSDTGLETHNREIDSFSKTNKSIKDSFTTINPRFGSHCTSRDTHVMTQSESAFSATAALAAFLDLRGKKFQKSASTADSKALEIKDDRIESSQKSNDTDPFALHTLPTIAQPSTTRKGIECVQCLPMRCPLEWERTIVANNDLLQSNSKLLQFCERFGQGLLTIIYRDFGAADGPSPDIILNSDACLILTSTQSLMQRCLPSQKASELSHVHQRIVALARKFETVMILIAWPQASEQTASSINDVSAFCSSVSNQTSADVKPIYIPYDTAEQMQSGVQAWVWKCFAEFAFPDNILKPRISKIGPITFLQDETVWELFLRKAGMNVITAQIVLSLMKNVKPRYSGGMFETDRREDSSLSMLMGMSAAERLSLFGSIIGDEVVNRLSLYLDSDI